MVAWVEVVFTKATLFKVVDPVTKSPPNLSMVTTSLIPSKKLAIGPWLPESTCLTANAEAVVEAWTERRA